ncbi:MAG TPA: hypothetical protein VGJ82_02750 [Thermoanaerobaculia bacterium]|jgi:hypothetical protein
MSEVVTPGSYIGTLARAATRETFGFFKKATSDSPIGALVISGFQLAFIAYSVFIARGWTSTLTILKGVGVGLLPILLMALGLYAWSFAKHTYLLHKADREDLKRFAIQLENEREEAARSLSTSTQEAATRIATLEGTVRDLQHEVTPDVMLEVSATRDDAHSFELVPIAAYNASATGTAMEVQIQPLSSGEYPAGEWSGGSWAPDSLIAIPSGDILSETRLEFKPIPHIGGKERATAILLSDLPGSEKLKTMTMGLWWFIDSALKHRDYVEGGN